MIHKFTKIQSIRMIILHLLKSNQLNNDDIKKQLQKSWSPLKKWRNKFNPSIIIMTILLQSPVKDVGGLKGAQDQAGPFGKRWGGMGIRGG